MELELEDARPCWNGTLHEFEIASLCNINPEDPDEAKTLIASLSRFSDESVQQIIEILRKSNVGGGGGM